MPTHAHQSLWEANDENPGITENAHLSEVYTLLFTSKLCLLSVSQEGTHSVECT